MKLATLFVTDIRRTVRSLTRQTLAKAVVISLFCALGLLFAAFIYLYGRTFFANLWFYEDYGMFVTRLILHGAVLVVIWFGLVSSLTESLLFQNGRQPRFEFLTTLPVSGVELTLWRQLKSIILNLTLISLFLAPAALAFQQVAGVGRPELILLVVFLVTLFTLGLGTTLGFLWTALFRNRPKIGLIFGGLIIAAVSLLLLETLLPSDLSLLYYAPGGEFFNLASSLPLANQSLYSYWLVELLEGNIQNIVPLSTLVAVVFTFGFALESSFIKRAWRLWLSRASTVFIRGNDALWQMFGRPLVLKDMFTLTRVGREFLYAVFQLSLSAVMFGLLVRAGQFRPLSRLELNDLLVLTYGWLMFFATAYLLRFVFPLMAREGKSRWLVLTLVSQGKLIGNKAVSAIYLTLPLIVLDTLLWLVSPFPGKLMLISFTVISLLFVSLLLVLLGAWRPDFEHGDQPERTSTSILGLLALALSLCWTVISARVLALEPVFGVWSLGTFSAALVTLMLIWRVSSKTSFRE